MHTPELFKLCKSEPTLQAYLGKKPFRLYPFANAPRDSQLPYAVWQRIGGEPITSLNGKLPADRVIIQLDVYAGTIHQVREVAKALFNHLLNKGEIIRYGYEAYEPAARVWRSSFDIAFLNTNPA